MNALNVSAKHTIIPIKGTRYRLTKLIQWLLAALSFSVCASLSAKPLIDFDINATTLAAALIQFSQQSKLQIFYRSPLNSEVGEKGIGNSAISGQGAQDQDTQVQSTRVKTVKGKYSADKALQLLLANSGLTYRFSDERTIILSPLFSDPAPLSRPSPETEARRIEEILVTGSHLQHSLQYYSASPMTVIHTGDIESQGVIATTDIIRNLTINTGAEFQINALNATETVGTSNINLRGLGLGSTLILLNSHRQAVSALATQDDASSFVDINSLAPLIMVERIEILKDGAAAIYGTDAVAGVVNFITYKHFEGFKLQGNYQGVTEGDHSDSNLSALYGHSFGQTNITLAGSYFERQALNTGDKDFTEGSAISSLGQPGTFQTSDGFVADPNCLASGREILNNGFCSIDITPFFQLSPEEDRTNLAANLTHQVNDSNNVYIEAGYVKNRGQTTASPSFPFAKFNPIVPADHPNNIFAEDVAFFGRVLGAEAGPSLIIFSHQTWSLAAKLHSRLSQDWSWQASVKHSSSNVKDRRFDTLSDRLVAALDGMGGPNNNELYNPFGRSDNSSSVIEDIIAPAKIDATSSLSTAEITFFGDLLTLPGGTVNAALGAQLRYEELEVDFGELKNANRFLSLPGGNDFSANRDIGAFYAELSAPVYDTLKLQAAIRYENYDGALDSFDPKLSVSWQPHGTLTLRSSFGTSFRAPSLLQTNGESGSNRVVDDPQFGITNQFRTVTTFGNRELKPEQATIFNTGLSYTPASWIQLHLDYWRYDYQDVITKENPQDLIDQAFKDTQAGLVNTPAQQKVLRNPMTGAISRLTTDFINAASILTDGVDLSLSLQWQKTRRGQLSLHSEWNYVNRYQAKQSSSSPTIDARGNRNTTNFARTVIKHRANTTLSWQLKHHAANLRFNYIGAYHDDENDNARIDDQLSVDLQYSHRFINPANTRQTKLAVGIKNLTDEDPPAVQTSFGFDTQTHDPRGRMIYLNITHSSF